MILSCNKKSSNTEPIVYFNSPQENIQIKAGKISEIKIYAVDPDGDKVTVVLKINQEKKFEFTEMPYSYIWNTKTVETGIFKLSAICNDSKGAKSTATINVDLIK